MNHPVWEKIVKLIKTFFNRKIKNFNFKNVIFCFNES